VGKVNSEGSFMNYLFDTYFKASKEKNSALSSVGVNFAFNNNLKLLLFDIDGIGCVERKNSSNEQILSYFAYTVSDVLIINMWTTDIGRHCASNYELLASIFRININLQNQKFSLRFYY